MDVEFDRAALADGLARVERGAATRTTRPVLAGVLVRATPAGVTLTATDTEVGVRAAVIGDVAAPGDAVVELSRLKAVVGAADAARVRLRRAADEHGVTVQAGGRWVMPGWEPAEFPDLPTFDDGGRYHEVTAGVLRTMIRRTAFAADKKDSTRFALSGVLWEAEGKNARLVATDSKRLAVCEGPATLYGPAEATKASHLVPAKTMQLLERNLTDDGELVRVGLRPNESLFQTERAMIYTRLVEGRYPPYQDLIRHAKGTWTVRVALPVPAFMSRVRQAAIMTDDESKRVDMTFEAGKVSMQARGADTGSSEVELPLPEYDGPEVRIAFDPQYLVEFLKALEGEPVVSLEMSDGSKPALFRCGDGYQYLVMPLSS